MGVISKKKFFAFCAEVIRGFVFASANSSGEPALRAIFIQDAVPLVWGLEDSFSEPGGQGESGSEWLEAGRRNDAATVARLRAWRLPQGRC